MARVVPKILLQRHGTPIFLILGRYIRLVVPSAPIRRIRDAIFPGMIQNSTQRSMSIKDQHVAALMRPREITCILDESIVPPLNLRSVGARGARFLIRRGAIERREVKKEEVAETKGVKGGN